MHVRKFSCRECAQYRRALTTTESNERLRWRQDKKAIPALSLRFDVVFVASTTAQGARNFVLSCGPHVGWDVWPVNNLIRLSWSRTASYSSSSASNKSQLQVPLLRDWTQV